MRFDLLTTVFFLSRSVKLTPDNKTVCIAVGRRCRSRSKQKNGMGIRTHVAMMWLLSAFSKEEARANSSPQLLCKHDMTRGSSNEIPVYCQCCLGYCYQSFPWRRWVLVVSSIEYLMICYRMHRDHISVVVCRCCSRLVLLSPRPTTQIRLTLIKRLHDNLHLSASGSNF